MPSTVTNIDRSTQVSSNRNGDGSTTMATRRKRCRCCRYEKQQIEFIVSDQEPRSNNDDHINTTRCFSYDERSLFLTKLLLQQKDLKLDQTHQRRQQRDAVKKKVDQVYEVVKSSVNTKIINGYIGIVIRSNTYCDTKNRFRNSCHTNQSDCCYIILFSRRKIKTIAMAKMVLLSILWIAMILLPSPIVVSAATVGVFEQQQQQQGDTATTTTTTTTSDEYYTTCSKLLQRSDLNTDTRISRGEFTNFISSLSQNTISLSNSGSTTPTSAITSVYLSYEDNDTRSMPLLTTTTDVTTFCRNIYNGMLQYYYNSTISSTLVDDTIFTTPSCVGAFQIADTTPENGRLLPDPEFVPFVRALVPTTSTLVLNNNNGDTSSSSSVSSTTSFQELPSLVQKSFTDFSINGEILESEGSEYLYEFCTRVAVAIAIEKITVLLSNPTPSPTTSPQLTPAPMSVPTVVVAPSPTTINIDTTTFFQSCIDILAIVDGNTNNILDSNEYVAFVRELVLLGNHSNTGSSILLDRIPDDNTPYQELPSVLRTNYERLSGSYGSEPPNLYGTKPDQVLTVIQKINLNALCSDTSNAIDATIELLLEQRTNSPTIDKTVSEPTSTPTQKLPKPIPTPTLPPLLQPIPPPISTNSTTSAPSTNNNNNNTSELTDSDLKRCKTSMVVSDANNDMSLSTDEYVHFVSRMTLYRYYNASTVLYIDLDPLFHTVYTDHVDPNLGILDVSGSRPMSSSTADTNDEQRQNELIEFCGDVLDAVIQFQKNNNETQPPTSDGDNDDDDIVNNDDTPGNITDEQLVFCQSALTKANTNSDTNLQPMEYILFLQYYMTSSSWSTSFGQYNPANLTSFTQLPKVIQDNYNSLILPNDTYVDITNADRIDIPSSSSSSSITNTTTTSNNNNNSKIEPPPHYQVVCQKTYETLWYYINYPNTTDNVDPSKISTKLLSCMAVVNTSDINADNVLDEEEYAQFVSLAAPLWNVTSSTGTNPIINGLLVSGNTGSTSSSSEAAVPSFEDLPYPLQNNYDWIRSADSKNAFRVDGASRSGSIVGTNDDTSGGTVINSNTTDSDIPPPSSLLDTGEILQLRWICDRTENVLDDAAMISISSSNSNSNITPSNTTGTTSSNSNPLLDFCKATLAYVDSDSDLLLTQDEYFQFIRRYTSSDWYGLNFDLLASNLRRVYEVAANVSGGFLFIEGADPNDIQTPEQNVLFTSFCSDFDKEITTHYPAEAFFERCVLSLQISDRNNDSKLNESEYVQFVRDLDTATDEDSVTNTYTTYESMDTSFKLNYKLIVQNKEQLDLYQIDSLSSTTFDEMQRYRDVCDSTREVLLTQKLPTVQYDTSATVNNAFLTGNTVGLSASNLFTGIQLQELQATYRAFVADMVTNASSTTTATSTDNRRLLLRRTLMQTIRSSSRKLAIVGYDDESVSIDSIADTTCPSEYNNEVPTYQCQIVDASFTLLLKDEKDPESEANKLSNQMQEAIDDGILQDKLSSITLSSPIIILGSWIAETNKPEDDGISNGARIFLIILGCIIGIVLFVILIYFCIRNSKRDRVHSTSSVDAGEGSIPSTARTSDNHELKSNYQFQPAIERAPEKSTTTVTMENNITSKESTAFISNDDRDGIGEFQTIPIVNESSAPADVGTEHKQINDKDEGKSYYEIEDYTAPSTSNPPREEEEFIITDFTTDATTAVVEQDLATVPEQHSNDDRGGTYTEAVGKSIIDMVEQYSDPSNKDGNDKDGVDDEEEDESDDEESDFELEVDIGRGTVVDTTAKKKYRSQIEELMKESCPEDLDNIEDLMDQFAGKEEELIETLKNMKVTRNEADDAANVSDRNNYRDEIESLVKEACPEDMDNIDDLIEQFAGREEELIETLKAMSAAKLIEENRKLLEESQKVIEDNKKVIEEKEKVVEVNQILTEENQKLAEENQKLLEENKRVAEEKQKAIEESNKALEESKKAIEESKKALEESKKIAEENQKLEKVGKKELDTFGDDKVGNKAKQKEKSKPKDDSDSEDSDDKKKNAKNKAAKKDNNDSDKLLKKDNKQETSKRAKDDSDSDEDSDDSDDEKKNEKKKAAKKTDSDTDKRGKKDKEKENSKKAKDDSDSEDEETSKEEDSDEDEKKKKNAEGKAGSKKVVDSSSEEDSDDESDDSDVKKKTNEKNVKKKIEDSSDEDSDDDDSDDDDAKKKAAVKKAIPKKQADSDDSSEEDDDDDSSDDDSDDKKKKPIVKKPPVVVKKKVDSSSDESDDDSNDSDDS